MLRPFSIIRSFKESFNFQIAHSPFKKEEFELYKKLIEGFKKKTDELLGLELELKQSQVKEQKEGKIEQKEEKK